MAETKTRKRVILAVAGLAILLIAYLALRKRPPAVPVVEVMREDLNASITSNGKVEPISPFVAHAEFPTFVAKVSATEGQSVHRGQAVLTLDAADVRAQLAQARADLLAAQNDLRNAQAGGPPDEVAQLKGDLAAARLQVANLERDEEELEALVAQRVATQDELAQNRANLAKARANLQALEAKKEDLSRRSASIVESATLRESQARDRVQALEEKVRSATVIAPFDGTLYSLPVKAGDYVKVGDTLAEMADLRHVRVRAFVDEPDLGGLEPGQSVEITWDAKPGQVWKGQTEQIPKQVVSLGMRSVGEVLCSVDNAKLELLPNVNVEVRILVNERRGVVVVPREAVGEDGGQHYVFVVEGNTVQRRNIRVGIANASNYEVLAGLTDGDRVALPRDRRLRSGMEIRPTEAE
ncbi:MAG TPA: efflux RND transporter periplasmic adaptor subunit [Candidatus Baltobacteraceae bacterium]|jgi:HlyD family secretion protein|nr:efflux RND transporter periplasmic adaptor subunit [Candidatus Baltobacteraceae bacterium]